MKIAWVGYIDSDNDKYYKQKLLELNLTSNEAANNDFIDILDNRDFLEETIEYDVVVLCYIYGLQSQQDQRLLSKKLSHKWRTSNLSTRDNWIKRLKSTNAVKIIAIGDSSEIASDYLLDIDGYLKEDCKFDDVGLNCCSNFCVYRKF
jgi:hypothetical protein